MPRVVRWYLKTALVYCAGALLVGILLASRWSLVPPAVLGGLGPVYLHLFMVGWITQLIIGVALWMFPKWTLAQPRGSLALAWATYVLLNVGLLARALGEPLNALAPGTIWGKVLVLSALLQWLAGIGFVANTWGRVKEK